jgi:DNA-directed RNA polymerase subunit RPC12/RpoP
MSYISERVAFIKGLAEGMKIDETTNEGKLFTAIIDVLDDISLAIEDVEEIQDEMGEQVDGIDEDLAELEKTVYDVEDEIEFEEIECPYCGEEIEVDLDLIDEDASAIECPHCHQKIELEWDCDCEDEECGCGCEHNHNEDEK